MRKILASLAIGTIAIATPAVANHPGHTDIPYASRGACESASAELSSEDQFWLPVLFPELFGSTGEAASFLTRAFACERNASDGQWYITDHRLEVLNSDWFQRR